MTEYVWAGVRLGAAMGTLAWFGGWGLGKVFKLLRYVMR